MLDADYERHAIENKRSSRKLSDAGNLGAKRVVATRRYVCGEFGVPRAKPDETPTLSAKRSRSTNSALSSYVSEDHSDSTVMPNQTRLVSAPVLSDSGT